MNWIQSKNSAKRRAAMISASRTRARICRRKRRIVLRRQPPFSVIVRHEQGDLKGTGECGAAVAVPKGREGWPRLVFCRGLVEKLCAGTTSLEWLAPQCSTARRQGHAIFRLSFTGKAANQRRNPFLDVCHVRQPLHCRALVICRKVRVLARNRGALVADNLARDKV